MLYRNTSVYVPVLDLILAGAVNTAISAPRGGAATAHHFHHPR